jgi:hypothetical protein
MIYLKPPPGVTELEIWKAAMWFILVFGVIPLFIAFLGDIYISQPRMEKKAREEAAYWKAHPELHLTYSEQKKRDALYLQFLQKGIVIDLNDIPYSLYGEDK